MVMKRNAMRKNLHQSILKSLGRYIAIATIIALGAALFLGLLMTKTDMVETGQIHMDQQNMYDLRLVNAYGWGQEQVDKAAQLEGVAAAEGVVFLDLIGQLADEEDLAVYRLYTIPERLNMLSLRGGRMPENSSECVIDGYALDESVIGSKLVISDTNEEDALESVVHREFTVVGYVASPLYMDMNRGTTTVGSGTLSNIFYVPADAFDVDYYGELHLVIPGSYDVYTDQYNTVLEELSEQLEAEAEVLCSERFVYVKESAEDAYQEGYEEYLDGLKEYEEGKDEAEKELADAFQELTDAETELEENDKKLHDAEAELISAQAELDEKEKELEAGWVTLKQNKAKVLPELDKAEKQLDDAVSMLLPGGQSMDSMFTTTASKVNAVRASAAILENQLKELDPEEDAAEIERIRKQIEALFADGDYQQALALQDQLRQIRAGYAQIASARTELAQAEQTLICGEQQIKDGRETIKNSLTEVYDGYEKLKEARQELDDGWEEYHDAQEEVAQELADAEAELADAKLELEDAREEIDDMELPEVYILDRTSNVGYNNLDSSSDIVAGVSRVLPVFFLLVASLVCITTMTRMIDEERTQIGTLKALGYSNMAIMSKYLIYAGSSAVLGCGIGVLVGSAIFPKILWQAYKIMLYIRDDIAISFNWWLCAIVVIVYTSVMLVVTWYCCRRALEEEPAELIRPKAPDPGKKLFIENLAFWHKVSFLNKVMVRNIFRYKQRLAMMLVGIGGCTALLLTGFGLRDSIINVVDYQFQEVTTYDLSVYFSDHQDAEAQSDFLNQINDRVTNATFYHQSSVELEYNKKVKEIYMISGSELIKEFIDLHSGKQMIDLPEIGEVVLSVGVCEALDIDVGDVVIMRDADMRSMELTVSGIYDNHVYNYSIVHPDTIAEQWGEQPDVQMAFVSVDETTDVHELSAEISQMDNIMNVAISEDLANMVKRMMEALDLVVVVVVICAGLLAFVVLYNLTNININERIREIATVKVLGFNASETAAYVFKENITLTVAGSLFGLLLGRLLLLFVMSQVKIDMVWFKALIMPKSYVWSIALTLLSSFIVDFVFYFKLDKINMAEALKSVE